MHGDPRVRAWACTQPLLRLMVKNKRGAIVNVLTSAIHGIPPKGFAAYTVAKHALRGMTLALAGEYSRRGVKVFSVSPGYMDTALTQQWDSRFREVARTNSRNTDPVVAAKRVFELYHVPQNLRVEHPDCGHLFPQEMREAAYKLLDETFK